MCVLLVSSPAAAQQTRPLEAPPPQSDEFTELLTWLEEHPGHTAFPSTLERLLSVAATVTEVEQFADTLLPVISDQTLLAQVSNRLGRMALLMRDYERAATLFQTAYIASGGEDLASLFSEAQALVQLGELAAAAQRGRTVVAQTDDYELKRRAYALVARSLHLQGTHHEAARMVETLATLDEASLVEPDTLLLQASVLRALGGDGTEALERLRRLHPGSLALLSTAARDVGSVLPAPVPATLFGEDGAPAPAALGRAESAGDTAAARRLDSAEDPPSSEEAASQSAPSVSAIQVGSFSDRDNAVHLARDLRELDLNAAAETATREGRELHVVMVRVPGGTPAEASRVLGVLREAGYDGFLVY